MKAMEQKSVEFSEKTGLDHFKGKRPEGEGSSDVAFGAPLFGPEVPCRGLMFFKDQVITNSFLCRP